MGVARIRKLLIANRGEIARRVQRTCRSLGIDSVAVFSDADADAPFVREADEAYRLGPASAAESYLNRARLIELARASRADAVHPGYGFLAENSDFASEVIAAGLLFVGPPPEVIAAMGLKHEARTVAARAGVPLLPAYEGDEQSEARLERASVEIGFPVLLKPCAGGGGKGMRVVREPAAVAGAVTAAKREALAAFGDDRLLVERYVERPRHVEVQILADAHGNAIHLFERECSVQRRYQKILEETPAPGLDRSVRNRMTNAALSLARAMNYESAGTVEFLLAPDGSFYFLEVNTRLQVEHPITECVTGVDLVAEQIRIAEGEPLRLAQEDVKVTGAAIEVRLYAEDSAAGFLPSAGRLLDYRVPSLPGVRVDDGVVEGSEVTIDYDPLLAKVIAHSDTRDETTRLLGAALRRMSVVGPDTNREFLVRLLEHPEFIAGRMHTHFVTERLEELRVPPSEDATEVAVVAAVLHGYAERKASMPTATRFPGFRIDGRSRSGPTSRAVFDGPHGPVDVGYRVRAFETDTLVVHVGGTDRAVRLVDGGARWVVFEKDGCRTSARVVRHGASVSVQTVEAEVRLHEHARYPEAGTAERGGGLAAPMPGRVLAVHCQVGDPVAAGDVLIVLEAMKMEHEVGAPMAGVVGEVHVAPGAQVAAGQLLAVVGDA